MANIAISNTPKTNMVKTKITKYSLAIIMALMSIVTHAETVMEKKATKTSPFLYGVGASSSGQIYKGYSQRTMLLPLIGYKSQNLTVFGPFISYKVKTMDDFSFSLKLSPRFQGYNQSDSDIFKGMKKRKTSLDAGFEINYKKENWALNFSSMFDTLNRSNGYEIKSVISRKYRIGPVFIEPSISASFLDSHLVDYYYGVSEDEVNSLRSAYHGQGSTNLGIGLSVSTPLFFGGFTRMNIQQLWFDNNITDSPLVDGKSTFSIQLFFTKNF